MALTPPQGLRAERFAVALALLVGCTLRLTGLEVHSLWFDEGGTTFQASLAPAALFRQLHFDRHPPLSFLAFHAWRSLAGESDAALRLLPALLSCASFALFAWLASRWLAGAAWVCAVALYAVAPLPLWHAAEVRMYTFVELGALLALCGCAEFLLGRRRGGGALVVLGQLVAFGSHYFGGLAAATVASIALGAWFQRRLGARAAIALVGCAALGTAAWIPWLVEALPDQLANSWGFATRLSARDLAELPVRLVLTKLSAVPESLRWAAVAASAVLVVGFALHVARTIRARQPVLVWTTLAFATPVAVALALATFGPPTFTPRYLVVAAPGAVLMMAGGLGAIAPRALRLAACAVAVGAALGVTGLQRAGNLREDYRSACADVVRNWRDGDRVVSITGTPEEYAQSTVRHYLREHADILASIRAPTSLAGAPRVHLVYRDARYSRAQRDGLLQRFDIVAQSEDRFRVTYFLLAAKR